MRSINPVLSLVLAVLGLAIFSASAAAATPPSPYDAGQPGLVADDWTPFVDAARAGDPLPDALAPGDDGMTAGGTGGICPTADACWIDGVGTYQTFPNCIIGGTGYVYTYVGYWGKDDFSYPQTGDRYWGHLVSGVVGSACGGEYIGTDVELPAATQFDLDGTPEGKIRCFYTSGKTGNTEEITNHSQADCRQNPGAGVFGGWGLGGRIIPAYGTFEVIFPIRSTQQNLGTSKLRAALDTALSYPKTAFPEAMVAVTAADPGPDPDPGPGPGPGPGPDPDPDPGPDPDPIPDPDPTPDPEPTPRATPLTGKLAPAGSKLKVTGTVTPGRAGDPLAATLFRSPAKGKPYKRVGTKSGSVGNTGAYGIGFQRPKPGRCKATVTIGADAGTGYKAAAVTVKGKC